MLMTKGKYNSNIYHELTVEIKENLRVAVLDVIYETLQTWRKKTCPPAELIKEFVSEDVRRIIERLSASLAGRHVAREYFILYRGAGDRKAFKVIKTSVEDMVELKRVVEANKPDWASRSETFPLAFHLPDDECYPFTCFWPQVLPYRKISHASIQHSGSRRGYKNRFRESLSNRARNSEV
jgi:hypothetical protein